MPDTAGTAQAEPAATASALTVIVALGVERRCLARGRGPHIELVQSGQGQSAARAAAEAALSGGADALACIGLAGALDPHLEPGDVVVPDRILDAAGTVWPVDAHWREAICERLAEVCRPLGGLLLTAGQVLAGPEAKREAARGSGATVCDMETAAVARVAAGAGVPFVSVRVVADGLADELPPGVDRWVDARGDSRLLPVLAACLRPARWRPTGVLIGRFRAAQRSLEAIARCLAPVAYCRPGGSR